MFLLMVMFFFYCPDCCKDNEWRGIRPLKSTRTEVEKQFGKPTPNSSAINAARYKTDDGEVSILYSLGSCGSSSNLGWNVPDLTVIDLVFYPKSKILFSKLTVDKKKFERRPDPEITYLDEYVNVKDGVSFTIDKDEDLVLKFRYFPNEKETSTNKCNCGPACE